jgi:hypothetical protein
VSQSPAIKDIDTEAKYIVGIHYQAITGEDEANCEDFICAIVTVISRVCNSVRLS